MESLRIRNEKLAAEVSRLRIENKSLKDKVNKYDFRNFCMLIPASLVMSSNFIQIKFPLHVSFM